MGTKEGGGPQVQEVRSDVKVHKGANQRGKAVQVQGRPVWYGL
jgi:hypothetical protein